ncbi:MAG: molybdopterin dinucleotide binding domain-containing protein [Actinomycetota bacterium]
MPSRQLRHMNCQLRDGAAGAVRADLSDILVHPTDAKEAGVTYGDKIRVKSSNGSLTGTARVTEELRPGTLSVPRVCRAQRRAAHRDLRRGSPHRHDPTVRDPGHARAGRNLTDGVSWAMMCP